jgi:7-cyano-7-deazaguanine reductase
MWTSTTPSLLFPDPACHQTRRDRRSRVALPFFGADIWTAYELSLAQRRAASRKSRWHTSPCHARRTHIVESKSFKLYLNSYNNTRFESADEVRECLRSDISQAVWRGTTPMSNQRGCEAGAARTV